MPDSDGDRRGTVDDDVAMFVQDFQAVLSSGRVTSLGPGEMFGEVAATYRTPHAASVVAATEAAVLEIDWQGLRELRRDQTFDAKLDEHYRRHWLPLHLRSTNLLRYLDAELIDEIAAASMLRSYGRDRWDADYRRSARKDVTEQIAAEPVVVAEGSFPTDLLLVRAGFGRVSVNHGHSVRTTSYLGAGHHFGLEAIVSNVAIDGPPRTHQCSLRAVGMLDVIAIPVELFVEKVLPKIRHTDLPDAARDRLSSRDRRREKRWRGWWTGSTGRRRPQSEGTLPVTSAAGADGDESRTALREVIVGARLNNGPAAMVIDLDRCTGCDDCVRACATTHGGNAMFARDGIRHGRLQFAAACMQCVDPVCMIGCPTGAITRDAADVDGVVTIDSRTCIGCQTCASACPYGNIDMVAVVGSDGEPRLEPETEKPIFRATKCDLCREQPAGAACVAACPHDALVRIDLTTSRPLDQFLRGRT